MKAAPLIRALRAHAEAPEVALVHTGQHYDVTMNSLLFQGLGLPEPDVNLEVGSGTHAQQTGAILQRFEPVLDRLSPACVIVVGDVNSTLACSLVAAKKRVPIVHVEAGLRSFDRAMPEEINRVLTDRIADVLYVTERSAIDNLRREGVEPDRIHFVGNVMIDSLLAARANAISPRIVLERQGIDASVLDRASGFGIVTLHRPSNVDDVQALRESFEILLEVGRRLPLLCPLHPRTRAKLEQFGLRDRMDTGAIIALPPQGYLEMVGLMAGASLVITDSGGIQEETTALGIPCLTMRLNTERPVTVEEGSNTLVGRDRSHILEAVDAVLAGKGKRGKVPELWDGKASIRIADHLVAWLRQQACSIHE
jgi:UDP-N-acetylglucosamine 2-epimerase (non-hydrolysing)